MRAGGAVGEAVVVAAAVTVVVGLVAAPGVGGALDPVVAAQILTLAAAAVGAGAALLGAFAARLTGDPRPRWVAAALALYAVVVLPATAIVVGTEAETSLGLLRLVAYVVATGLLLAAVRPPPRAGALWTWTVTLVGGLLAVAALGVAAVAPDAARAVVDGPVAPVVVIAGWITAAAVMLVDSLLRDDGPWRRVGFGLVVLVGAQLYRRLTADAPIPLLFETLRLLALAMVAAGLAQLVARAMTDLHTERSTQQEDLSLAALHMERASELAAERDHELRNGLAGLAGITHLLSSPVDGAEQERLRHAVLAELTRLHTLLDPAEPDPTACDPMAGDHADPAASYLVAPVLDGLVALRRAYGVAVELHVEAGLRACGDSAVLAQVVTNLLANCDRHAPGAPFTIRAVAEGERAVIRVRDTGPGLPPGREESVLRPGVRNAAAGGSGLGLSISNRLVEREGGTLMVATEADPRGCLATVAVPLGSVGADGVRSGPVELPRTERPDDSCAPL